MHAHDAYPLFLALAGFAASAGLTQRALSQLQPAAKAALVDAAARTRMLGVLVIAVFFALLLWRPLPGWAFLGCAYLALGARSVVRLRRLGLPARPARLLLAGNLAAVAGVAACAFLIVLRMRS
jgi:hypothetical protein